MSVLEAIENYISAKFRGDPSARERLYEFLDRMRSQVPGELDNIEHGIRSSQLVVGQPTVVLAAIEALRQVYGRRERPSDETKQIEEECRKVLGQQKALVSLQAQMAGQNLSTEDWTIKVVDGVAAELMPKYGLSRNEFQDLIRKVWTS